MSKAHTYQGVISLLSQDGGTWTDRSGQFNTRHQAELWIGFRYDAHRIRGERFSFRSGWVERFERVAA